MYLQTSLPLIDERQVDSVFMLGPREQMWKVIKVDELNKKVLCKLENSNDSVWLSDHLVYDLLEDYDDRIKTAYGIRH